jgi:hypothetical protein
MIKHTFKSEMDRLSATLEALVGYCDDKAWTDVGCGYMMPARVALHAVMGVEYYTQQESEIRERFADSWSSIDVSELPSRDELLAHWSSVKKTFDLWLDALDPNADNSHFPWAGPVQLGVLLFLLRHTTYHVGELNALLYQQRKGDMPDAWMDGFKADPA